MKDELLNVSQSLIAQALAADYFCIYYVNVETDRFAEYFASEEYEQLQLPKNGDDFIAFARRNFESLIFPMDRERFFECFTKENVVDALNRNKPFTMTFRMILSEEPTHVHLKITRMIEKEQRHAVIGISSVDEQMKAREAYEAAHQASLTYSGIAQALAADMFSIYVVNPEDDSFYEYSSAENYDELGVEKQGSDFFELSRKNMSRLIDPRDRERFLRIFTKENILTIVKRDGHFTTKYRLMIGGSPVWVSLKATLMEHKEGKRLIFGSTNIDAQMKREDEYRKQVEKARNEAKNDFLANMSHDIRTPMNAIVGYTNIALNHMGDEEMIRSSLSKIESSSHYLLSLINDILDISKIESGKMQLNEGRCDLSGIFERIEDITELQAKQKSLEISYDHESVKHTLVIADELRIEQILVNIVSNAIKYTPEKGKVDLKCLEEEITEGKSRYRFVVSDTGIGISEEYLPHIFESFTREERTTINRVQGTGLGLAITAKVVEMMHGIITVDSKVNEGSVFTVELTLPHADASVAEEKEIKRAEDLSGKRILLVEDNFVNAEIATMILSSAGMRITRAENGRIAVDLISEDPDAFDAVLMDLQMPVMNGYEASEEIRKMGKDEKVLPIIALSANAFDEDVRRAKEAGMNDHIAKPFTPETILSVLSRYLLEK